jgi:hypothetical protein
MLAGVTQLSDFVGAKRSQNRLKLQDAARSASVLAQSNGRLRIIIAVVSVHCLLTVVTFSKGVIWSWR